MKNIFKKNKKCLNDTILIMIILFMVFSLFLFIILPLYEVFKQSIFDSDNNFSLKSYREVFSSGSNTAAILNTLILAATVGITSTFTGYAFAYTEAYIQMKGKKIFNMIALLPVISPPFAISLSIILLFGNRGLITRELFGLKDFNIYGFPGLVSVQTLSYFPMAYLLLNGVLKTIDPSVEEASENLGGSRKNTFFKVTFPLTKSAMVNSFLLVFIKSVSDFGNPIAIGGGYNTLAVQIYQQALGNYDMAGAAALSVLLLDISLILFILSKYYFDGKSYITVTGKSAKKRNMIKDKKIKIPLVTFCAVLSFWIIILYVLIPVNSLIKLWGIDYSFTFEHYIYAFSIGGKAIADTVIFSVVAAPIAGIIAVIIAFLIVRKNFIGKSFIDFTSILGIAVPGTVIGIGYVIAFNSPPVILTGTALIIVIAFIARTIPVGIKSGINTLQQIDPSIEEAAQDLGADSFKVFTTITLPMIKSAFLGGMIYSFIKSMTSLSAVIFLISAKYNLLTISVLDQVEAGKFGVASAFSTVLILIVYIVITLMQMIVNKTGNDGLNRENLRIA